MRKFEFVAKIQFFWTIYKKIFLTVNTNYDFLKSIFLKKA